MMSTSREAGMTGRNIARYIRVNQLIEPLKVMLDAGEISLVTAVDLSFLDEKEQEMVSEQAKWGNVKISQKAVRELRERSGSMKNEDVADVMNPKAGALKTVSIKIPVETGEKYFSGKTAKERSEVVVMALEAWFSRREAACV